MEKLPEDFIHDLNSVLDENIFTDLSTRFLFSTDASIYKIMPLGVVFPKRIEELDIIMGLADQYDIPVLARGAGSSLAGQAVGKALVVDCSRYLDHIIDINPEERKISVEPGVILNTLNHAVSGYQLQFGPDPSSAERATIAGSVSNNATGSHSILYGMAADHVHSIDAVLSDGSQVRFKEISIHDASRLAKEESTLGNIYASAIRIREQLPDFINNRWPKTYRTVSGYNLNYLIPWSPAKPTRWDEIFPGKAYPPVGDDNINLAQLIAGSEGTLGIIRSLELNLVALPKHKILVVQSYKDIYEACDNVPNLLETRPSAIELIPQELVRLARTIPGYARNLPDEFDGHASLLVLEYSGDYLDQLKDRAKRLENILLVAESIPDQELIWGVRKVGLGILMSRPGDYKPIPGIEDMSVPVECLGDFVREVQKILKSKNTTGEFYGHASAGCLHIRPVLNIKTSTGREKLRDIGRGCVDLVKKFGGSISAEHGDGLARGEWLEILFGSDFLNLFKEMKLAADPKYLLNPGKIINVSPLDENLRYPNIYHAEAWIPKMDFSKQGGHPGEKGLIAAVEQCNGAGVCRKHEGFMCPSFQATRDEMHSTRGRANLLREMMYGNFPSPEVAVEKVYQALDLCLACKGCKVECPSAVDMAKIKYEFLDHYYARFNKRKIRDYLFAYIDIFARVSYPFATVINKFYQYDFIKRAAENLLGISRHRKLPELSNQPFLSGNFTKSTPKDEKDKVILLLDAFNRYFHPEVSRAACEFLEALDYEVIILPINGAGRTLISKGFLNAARRHADKLVKLIYQADPSSQFPILGLEPSEIYTLRDELEDLLPNEFGIRDIGKRAYFIDEFLIRPGQDGIPRIRRLKKKIDNSTHQEVEVLLHGHCYQKAQLPGEDGYPSGVEASKSMLEQAGYSVKVIEAGCCGMAGSFGYEADHYQVSMAVGETALFPAVRDANRHLGSRVVVAATGVSCKSQIEDGTSIEVIHPILLINRN